MATIMSEKTTTKRHRDHNGATQMDTTKRHKKPTMHDDQRKPDPDFDPTRIPILTVPSTTQDLSYLFTNLSPGLFLEPDPDSDPTRNTKEEAEDKESVIRHLLEASDDELGLPKVDCGGDDDVAKGYFGDFEFGLCDGLWELEDEVANYYTLLQSELFMQ